MAGIGKLFKKGKRPPEPPTKDYDRRSRSQDDDSDDGCYLDPTKVHPTLHPNTAVMPSYPPPRPQHSPKNSERRSNGNASTRASLSSEDQARPVKPPRRHGKGESSKQNAPADDYCDPWDAARVPPMRQQFSTSSTSSGGGEAYCDPLDVSPPPNPQPSGKDKLDDYCDPWDSRKVKPPVAKKPTGRDEYMDPWDAKNPQSRTTPKDSDDENYSEPYDAGKVTVLDEQAKRMSLRGMRLPSQGEQVQSPTTDTRPLDDYDSPWESKGLVRPPSLASTSLGEQNKEVDSRPSEDYDKPWEWMARKTQHMSMASPAIPKPQNTATPKQQNSSNPKPQPYAKPQSYYVKTQASPQIDSRPPDDYDAPWEYNKRTSQLVSMVTEQGAVDKASFPPKPPRTFDEEVVSTGFEVDPELPLVKQT
ncbi:predicted protein [Nematostella vectensis]|uniref:Uncharacterized protein n=1 Tax=Nematostella vectensis TaxID=45351 RepID=A7RS67_NEMVE|nr:predicted protein [Nematostella vectensis]|eukprot:XP_001637818.1 predicted protein [Nematostella vectensis]